MPLSTLVSSSLTYSFLSDILTRKFFFNKSLDKIWIIVYRQHESPSWVKNVEVEFKIKPRHPISRGNMSVDQLFLIHCSRKSSYFSNFRWCAQSMLTSKGIVNSAMITFFELTDQMTIYIYIYIYIYAPSWFEMIFHSPRLLAVKRLKNSVCRTILPIPGVKAVKIVSYLFQSH